MNENIIGNIESEEKNGNINLKTKTSPFKEFFFFTEIYDEKVYKKFIKNTERLIRTSNEYSEYVKKLHDNFPALNMDNILSNITTSDADIEFHHYPFSLFDIVDIVVSHNLLNKKDITTFSIAKEIMDLHFKNCIGLVPLSHTMHELAHSGALFISEKQIFGNWKKFKEKYEDGISRELDKKLNLLKENSDNNNSSDINGIL